MAESADHKMQALKEAGKTAVILGYTGETGALLTKLLAKEKIFSKVTLIGRRKVKINATEFGPEFVSVISKFDTPVAQSVAMQAVNPGVVSLNPSSANILSYV